MLALGDQQRGVLSNERQMAIASTFSEMLDDVLGDFDKATATSPVVLLVSAPGALNFAATLAFSGLLKFKNIPHQMLAQDAISPGKTIPAEATQCEFVSLCYLTTPTEAKHKYLLRRVVALAAEAKVLSVAWTVANDQVQVQTPANAMSILPRATAKPTHPISAEEAALLSAAAI